MASRWPGPPNVSARHSASPTSRPTRPSAPASSPGQFRARTGTSPHQWLLTQRTALAHRLLESTTHAIEHIADEAGLGTAAAMRLHFQRARHT